MSPIPRKPPVKPGKMVQDFTALVDAVPQRLTLFDTAKTTGIVRTASGQLELSA